MSVQALFPTLVYADALPKERARKLNAQLLVECLQLREDDAAGRAWSKTGYPGGYTSYGSAHRLQRVSPTFGALELEIDKHVAKYVRRLAWDLSGRRLEMTDCWVNIMPARTAHPSHLHPLSSVSGTYYVQVPRGAPGLKFEDPRLDKFMAAPPRSTTAARSMRPWVTFSTSPGRLLLFESWLRHEVPANTTSGERVSISFNYNWF